MNDRLTEEGIEHLQAAARELISAARIFLDVVEDLVDEPERVVHSLSGAVEVFRDMTGRPVQPWEAHAWAASGASRARGSTRVRGTRSATDATDRTYGGGEPREGRGDHPTGVNDEPTLFQTDTDPGTGFHPSADDLDGGSTDASDRAVWDEDEPHGDGFGDSSVVDIRRAERKPVDSRGSGSAGSRLARAAGSEEPPKRSSVKRITVD